MNINNVNNDNVFTLGEPLFVTSNTPLIPAKRPCYILNPINPHETSKTLHYKGIKGLMRINCIAISHSFIFRG